MFCTFTGCPLGQRNVTRALRAAQRKAKDESATPRSLCFISRTIKDGRYRWSTASYLRRMASGTRDANVTRAGYARELADTRRRSMRRSRMLAEYGDLLKR